MNEASTTQKKHRNPLLHWSLKILRYFGTMLGLLVVVLAIMSIAGLPISLNFLKDKIESGISNATGRDFFIDGKLGLVPGFSPRVTITQVRMSNPQSWTESDFATIDEASASLHLLPLLDSEIQVGNIVLAGTSISFEKMEDGTANWIFQKKIPAERKNKSEDNNDPDNTGKMVLTAIEKIDLSDIHIDYRNAQAQQAIQIFIENALGTASENQPVMFELNGSYNDLPLSMEIQTTSLNDLFQGVSPLPLALATRLGNSTLELDGSLKDLENIELGARLYGGALSELNDALGLSLPAINQYDVSASLSHTGTALVISDFNATFDQSSLAGHVDVDYGNQPLTLVGAIHVETLDLAPFLSEIDDSEESAAEPAVEEPETGNQSLTGLSEQLSKLDIDVKLDIDHLRLAKADITDSAIHLRLQDGQLQTPLNINLNEIPLQGNLLLTGDNQGVDIKAEFLVENTEFGDLEQWINLDNIDGSLKSLNIRMETRGQSIKDLSRQLLGNLTLEDARLSYGDEDSDEVLEFEINRLEAIVAGTKPLSLDVNGTILGEVFELNLNGGNIKQLLKGKEWPIELQAHGAGAVLDIHGHMRKRADNSSSELSINLSGQRFGDLAAWSGTSKHSDASYALSGNASLSSKGWALSELNLQLGNSAIGGLIKKTIGDEKDLLHLQFQSELIDLPEITSIFVDPDTAEKAEIETIAEPVTADETQKTPVLKIPVLPQGIEIADTDIDVKINEFKLDEFGIRNIGFAGQFREGILQSSPFSMQLGVAIFNGDISFNSLATIPEARFSLGTNNIDIGALLAELQVTQEIKMSAKSLGLEMNIRGASLGKVLKSSEISAHITEGEWLLSNPGGNGKLPITVEQAVLNILPDQPISLHKEVLIKDQPVSLKFEIDHPAVAKETGLINLDITVHHDETDLHFTGQTTLPLNTIDLELGLEMRGEFFSSMNEIVGMRLPEVGPYEIRGNFGIRENGYFLDNLEAQVGESILSGHAVLETNTVIPEFEVELTASNIQLNDFQSDKPADESEPQTASTADVEPDPEITNTEEPAVDNNIEENPRFTAESLALANGTLDIYAQNVFSGTDRLGQGILKIDLRDSNLNINPVSLRVPGGDFDAQLSLSPDGDGVKAHLAAKVDKFNYGILARRVDPETDMSGLVSLDIELDSKTRYLDRLLQKADGYVDFAVIPHEFESGIIDLWAVGLVSAILPRIGADVSVVNCLIARLDMEDGIMEEDALILDTSKLRATGKANINFHTEELFVRLEPEAKQPQMFRIEAPIEVEGSFADIGFGLGDGVFGTALRMVTTTATTPFKRLFGKEIPEDGSDICADPMQRNSGQSDQ